MDYLKRQGYEVVTLTINNKLAYNLYYKGEPISLHYKYIEVSRAIFLHQLKNLSK